MSANLPPCPPSLKSIQHFLKTASEHENRDIVIVYWCRLYALQTALKIDKKSEEAHLLLVKLMDWLESMKGQLSDNEAITNDVAAQAHVENSALKLFSWATSQDEAGIFNKNVVKAFYTAGMLMEVLKIFGELSEEIENKCKYSKWKAAYIHNCLKNGEVPEPGPVGFDNEENELLNEITTHPARNSGIDSGLSGASSVGYQPVAPAAITPPVIPNPVQPGLNVNIPSPAPRFQPPSPMDSPSTGSLKLDALQITKAQKYCKFASSALNYDDVPEAIKNLQLALKLLTTGEDS